MSAAKRRIKRKIARLVRMDATLWRLSGGYECPIAWPGSVKLRAAMQALGVKLARSRRTYPRAWDAVTQARAARGQP